MSGRHARVSPLACAAMQTILTAPADDPADTETIITTLGRRPWRVLWVLGRLEHRGWVTGEWVGRDRIYRPAYDAHWYKGRLTNDA